MVLIDCVEKDEAKDMQMDRDARKWTWWPTWYELRTHYFKELGFLACLSQMIGATVFVSLPPCSIRVLVKAAVCLEDCSPFQKFKSE